MDVVYNVTFSCLFHWIILNRSKVQIRNLRLTLLIVSYQILLVLFQAPFNSPLLNILT
jgi:hypothetical protein